VISRTFAQASLALFLQVSTVRSHRELEREMTVRMRVASAPASSVLPAHIKRFLRLNIALVAAVT